MAHISDIKLIRTDTTLDLSQKAEKGMCLDGWIPSTKVVWPLALPANLPQNTYSLDSATNKASNCELLHSQREMLAAKSATQLI
ncbi:hypothetical protein JHK82_056024 [Glycine max]|uniref:Uncharacterized protein n=2 Tax=Glycine subgen. Soja TaxID=1462606 RepID=K7N2P9_SOYBN|nr:hypothetical protein JHK86_055845 [Glycine max]RZB43226.1 hypothetical protein D0Y65_053702 [Glycine soja]KAG4918586.1 hypothetical protein JHK85_056867 [Glycine max]KAG5074656.1 hypothetical protein JHK84_055887 [Glycine max]KAG5077329.1 hypothetical protein JHK82_056024 [Glycine max]